MTPKLPARIRKMLQRGIRPMTREAFQRAYYKGKAGEIRSHKRENKRALMREHKLTSGRQWRRWKKRNTRINKIAAQTSYSRC